MTLLKRKGLGLTLKALKKLNLKGTEENEKD
jgi:hypothetical protein